MNTLLVLALALAAPRPGGTATIDLGAGHRVVGEIVKENEQHLFVDLGYTVLAVPRSEILAVSAAAEPGAVPTAEGAPAAAAGRLYRSGGWAPATVRENVRRVGDGVVLVRVPGALGSGFVIDEAGWLITNTHVIEDEQQISVTVFVDEDGAQDKRVFEDVELVSFNPLWDLALLRIPAEQLGDFRLTALPLADMTEVRVGDPVFAVGNPLGLERSVSEGIVSKTNRAARGMLYVQTTAAINGGNSGGPLLNLRGEVIGVNTWGYFMTEGLNFAIPATTLKSFLDNRDAFAFDKEQANSGFRYPLPPRRPPADD